MLEETVTVGRRKTAVAAVRLRPGVGKIDVNGRKLEDYFTNELQRKTVLAPFEQVGDHKKHDIILRINGGGVEGQAVAARLAIARALLREDENLHGSFKTQGFLMRDSRKRERKKYGRAGARKRFQFSKR